MGKNSIQEDAELFKKQLLTFLDVLNADYMPDKERALVKAWTMRNALNIADVIQREYTLKTVMNELNLNQLTINDAIAEASEIFSFIAMAIDAVKEYGKIAISENNLVNDPDYPYSNKQLKIFPANKKYAYYNQKEAYENIAKFCFRSDDGEAPLKAISNIRPRDTLYIALSGEIEWVEEYSFGNLVREMIDGLSKFKITIRKCPICGNIFIPKKKNVVACSTNHAKRYRQKRYYAKKAFIDSENEKTNDS